jgi:hypothetical protein
LFSTNMVRPNTGETAEANDLAMTSVGPPGA